MLVVKAFVGGPTSEGFSFGPVCGIDDSVFCFALACDVIGFGVVGGCFGYECSKKRNDRPLNKGRAAPVLAARGLTPLARGLVLSAGPKASVRTLPRSA